MMRETDITTILETLAKGIRELETEKLLKDLEIDRLKATVAELKKELEEKNDAEG